MKTGKRIRKVLRIVFFLFIQSTLLDSLEFIGGNSKFYLSRPIFSFLALKMEPTRTSETPEKFTSQHGVILSLCLIYFLNLCLLSLNLIHTVCNIPIAIINKRGGAVGWGTALQAGRSCVRFPMVSLEFFIDVILPAAL